MFTHSNVYRCFRKESLFYFKVKRFLNIFVKTKHYILFTLFRCIRNSMRKCLVLISLFDLIRIRQTNDSVSEAKYEHWIISSNKQRSDRNDTHINRMVPPFTCKHPECEINYLFFANKYWYWIHSNYLGPTTDIQKCPNVRF